MDAYGDPRPKKETPNLMETLAVVFMILMVAMVDVMLHTSKC